MTHYGKTKISKQCTKQTASVNDRDLQILKTTQLTSLNSLNFNGKEKCVRLVFYVRIDLLCAQNNLWLKTFTEHDLWRKEQQMM